MFSESKRAAIIELHKQGHGSGRIAQALGASRTTVRYIINSGTVEVPKVLRPNKGEPYRALILELCSICHGNLERVHKELMAQGAQISYQALTGFVRRNHLWKSKSDITRSVNAAQEWLAEIIHGARALEILKTQFDDSSDLATLLYSVKNGRGRERKKAATILARKRGIPNTIVAKILHSSRVTTRRYFKMYSEAGPSVLFDWSTHHSTTQADDAQKTGHIIELIHNKPSAFGINRTTWTQCALIHAYKECHNESMSRSTITRLLKNAGYGWRKARRVLTSPDPNYRDKVELLLKTLKSLTASEMLFFLDEWGPVQVRRRGGNAYRDKDNIPRIPRHQTSKGTVALVAALSATTNQMTWEFVISKDTRSMMSLLEMLYNQYYAKSKLYVTWDAVSWHNSATLMEWLDQFNTRSRGQGGPVIELIPLPTSAQFLNVIEGVLSGMTRAVINNSDYQSPRDMKLAISRHFNERNEHFRDNPRRAGKKIWEMDFFQDFDALRAGDYREW